MAAHQKRQKLSFEQVEDRRLMSASPWSAGPVEIESNSPQAEIQSVAGSEAVLTIQGTDADEQITIEPLRRGRLVRVQVVDQATEELTLNRVFSARRLDSIQVNAGDGKDRVIQSTRLPAIIDGGDGDDGLYSRSESELVGGAGSDRFLIAHSRRGGEAGTPLDQQAGEVRIHLHDGGRKQVEVDAGGTGSWAGGRFRSQEVALLAVPGFPVMAWPMIEWVLDHKLAHLHRRGRHAERSVIVFGSMEATLTPLMERIEQRFSGVRVFSLPSFDHAQWGRHIELGVKGDPAVVNGAWPELLQGLQDLGVRLGPELVR